MNIKKNINQQTLLIKKLTPQLTMTPLSYKRHGPTTSQELPIH